MNQRPIKGAVTMPVSEDVNDDSVVQRLTHEVLAARNNYLLMENERLGAQLRAIEARVGSRRYRLADSAHSFLTTGLLGRILRPVFRCIRRLV
jgi:hypothetical protein